MNPFLRHIEACNNHPGLDRLVPWRLDGAVAGYLPPASAERLAALPGWARAGEALALTAPDPSATLATAAAALGIAPRGELFDVRATPESPSLALLDRGAIPPFGVIGQGVHVNGLVRRGDGLHLWIGWRSRHKPVAPGLLDNIIAGGTPAGLTPRECLVKEAEEEASVPEALARTAREAGAVSYIMAVPQGTRRDVMHIFDLDLPEDFTPQPNDDEVERFELWPARRVLEFVRDTDQVKFNVNLVLIDLFLREGMLAGSEAAGLRAALSAPVHQAGL
jgi:8-oxo-dGTP pyrophosphatase MutT (NUDIX family)